MENPLASNVSFRRLTEEELAQRESLRIDGKITPPDGDVYCD